MNRRNLPKSPTRALSSPGFAIGKIVIPTLSAILLAAPFAHAASATWTGNTDGVWATTNNWSTSPVPGTGDTATFNGLGNGNTTIDLGAGVTLGTLLFDTSSAAAYTIGSGAVGSQTLTLGTLAGGIQMNSTVAANQTINANLALSTTGTYTVGLTNNSTTNTLTVAGGISASTGGAKVLTVTGAGNTIVSGNITNGTGSMALTKTGTGALLLSGTNALGGSLVVNAGRLNVTAGTTNFAGAFSNLANTASTTAAASVSSGATLGWTGNNGGNFGGAASASGALYNAGTFNQTGTVANSAGIYLGNANNAYGYLYNTGTTAITARLWVGNNDGATVTNGAAGLLDIANGTVTVTGTNQAAAFQINAPNKTYTTTAGFAGVNITGGTLALTPSQTYQINTGVRLYSSVNVSGAGAKITTGATGGFNLNNTSNALNSTTFTIGNGGEVDTSFISNTGSAASTGILTFDNGTLKATAADATALIRSGVTTFIQSGGATIDTNGFSATIATPLQAPAGNGVTSIALGGTTTGYVGAPIVQITGGGGTGAAAIANFDPATGTVTGITVTSAGSGYTSTPTITLVGGNGGSTGAGTGTATATATTGAVTSGGLTKTGAGTLTLTAANTYTGATTISQGTLRVNGSLATTGTVGFSGTGSTLAGAGTVGAVTLSSGNFLAPGDGVTAIGTLAANSLTLNGGNFTFDLSASGNTSDLIAVTGALTDGGTAYTFDFSGGLAGQTYTLITFGSTSFADATKFSSTGVTGTFNLTANSLTFTAVPEPHEFAIAISALLGALIFARRRQARRCE